MITPDQQLDDLASLQPNWDGEDASVIAPAIIEAARSFLKRLPDDLASEPLVVPSPSGTLQFEWETLPQPGQYYLEMEVETPTTIHYLKQADGLDEEDVFDIHDTSRAESLIRWFVSKQKAN